jgi:hypothetical protein
LLPLADIGCSEYVARLARDFTRKKRIGVRSAIMGKPSTWSFAIAFFASTIVVFGNAQAQTPTSSISNRGSHKVVVCKKDSECPSGQRCGFSGSQSKGKCVVPSHDAHCIDPGGRCGCDGSVVDIFCAVGSRTEYTSAPACFIGGCPKTCTAEADCGKTGLVCRKGVCVKP